MESPLYEHPYSPMRIPLRKAEVVVVEHVAEQGVTVELALPVHLASKPLSESSLPGSQQSVLGSLLPTVGTPLQAQVGQPLSSQNDQWLFHVVCPP